MVYEEDYMDYNEKGRMKPKSQIVRILPLYRLMK